jgi:hypothetical protein
LSDESTRSSTVFGSWVQESLVSPEDLTEHIRQKAHRGVKPVKDDGIWDSDKESFCNSDMEYLASDME